MKIKSYNGYSKQTYVAQFGSIIPKILIGDGLETRLKFDPDTKRPVETGEIDSKRGWLYYPGLSVQSIKLPPNFSLPKTIDDLSDVELVNPEACIVGRNVYVRAEGLTVK